MNRLFLVPKLDKNGNPTKRFMLCNENYNVIFERISIKQWRKLERFFQEDGHGSLFPITKQEYLGKFYTMKNGVEVVINEYGNAFIYWDNDERSGESDLDSVKAISEILDMDLRMFKKCQE